jgi:hypothetical protein
MWRRPRRGVPVVADAAASRAQRLDNAEMYLEALATTGSSELHAHPGVMPLFKRRQVEAVIAPRALRRASGARRSSNLDLEEMHYDNAYVVVRGAAQESWRPRRACVIVPMTPIPCTRRSRHGSTSAI